MSLDEVGRGMLRLDEDGSGKANSGEVSKFCVMLGETELRLSVVGLGEGRLGEGGTS